MVSLSTGSNKGWWKGLTVDRIQGTFMHRPCVKKSAT